MKDPLMARLLQLSEDFQIVTPRQRLSTSVR